MIRSPLEQFAVYPSNFTNICETTFFTAEIESIGFFFYRIMALHF